MQDGQAHRDAQDADATSVQLISRAGSWSWSAYPIWQRRLHRRAPDVGAASVEDPAVQVGGGPTTCTPNRRPAETMVATSKGAGVSSPSLRGDPVVTNHSSTPDGA